MLICFFYFVFVSFFHQIVLLSFETKQKKKKLLDNKEKFLELFEPVYGSLWKFILSTSSNRNDAKDILSETILLAFSNIDKLKKIDSFKSFIYTIASRERNRYYRKKQKVRLYDSDIFPDLNGGINNPEISTELNLVYELLEGLPEKQKEALILFEIHGMNREEIAKIQNTTIINVKMRLYRARKFLDQLNTNVNVF